MAGTAVFGHAEQMISSTINLPRQGIPNRLGLPATMSLLTAGVVSLLVMFSGELTAVLVVLVGAAAILAIGIVPARRTSSVTVSATVVATMLVILTVGSLNPLISHAVPRSAVPHYAVLLADAGLVSCIAALVLILSRYPIVGLLGLAGGVLLLETARYVVLGVFDAATEGAEDWTSFGDALAAGLFWEVGGALVAVAALAAVLRMSIRPKRSPVSAIRSQCPAQHG
jgi:hypothetical protein